MTNYYMYMQNPNSQDFEKYNEKKQLGKMSNGIGIFVITYFLLMQVASVAISLILSSFFKSAYSSIAVENLTYIFIATFAAFISGLFYFLFSKRKMSDTIQAKHTKFTFLIPLVFIGLAVSMLANLLSNIVIENFSFFGLENNVDFSNETNSSLDFFLSIVASAIVPAFAEEFAFRGLVMGVLRKYGDAFAIIASAVLFGAMHGNITQIPFAFTLGLMYGLADCKTNSIFPSIIMHLANNFYAVMADVLINSTSANQNIAYGVVESISLAFCVIGFLSFIYIAKKDKSFFKLSSTEPNGYSNSNVLSLKEKCKKFFLSPAIICVLSIFTLESILYLTSFFN